MTRLALALFSLKKNDDKIEKTVVGREVAGLSTFTFDARVLFAFDDELFAGLFVVSRVSRTRERGGKRTRTHARTFL